MISSWNVRGLNDPKKQSEVNTLIARNKLAAIGLIETRVKQERSQKVQNNLKLYEWQFIDNYQFASSGRIWVAYDAQLTHLQIVSKSDQTIHCKMQVDGNNFYWTIVYGSNLCAERRRLWESIQVFANDMNTPWIIQSDFNAILNMQEGTGGNETDNQASQDFTECVSAASLIELRSKGCFYTWANNQELGSKIWKKLDRCLVNLAWLEKYALSEYDALPPGLSDHSPLIVAIRKELEKGNVPFRFFNM